jgi:4-amino-4-deoxy-L-arabinose transferase-like glycosyltransferase
MNRSEDAAAPGTHRAAGVAPREVGWRNVATEGSDGDATSPPAAAPRSLLWRGLLVASLAGGVVLLPNLGTMALWGSEGRWAMIARAMWQTGDLLRPVMGAQQLYWDKPLLSYWQVLPVAAARGHVDEVALRLPSALWAVLLLALTYDLAARWYDRTVATLSVLVLAGNFGFVFWGRNAQVEMTNAALTLLLLWIFCRHRRDADTRWVYVVAVVAGLGANMKGLTVYGAPAFCVLLLGVVERDWSWLPRWTTIAAAAALSLAVLLSFHLVASVGTRSWEPLTVAWRENVLRYFAPFDHEDPAWTYFVRIFDLFAPWSLLLPLALARRLPALWRRGRPVPPALVFAVGTFVFFTLSGSRRPYYLLPILPFVAPLVAELLRDWSAGRLTERAARVVSGFAIVLGAILVATLPAYCLTVPLAHRLPVDPRGLGWAALGAALAGAATIACARRRNAIGLAVAVLATWAVYSIAVVPCAAAQPGGVRDDAARLRELQRACSFLGTGDTRVEFYLDTPCVDLPDEATALVWARRNHGFVVTPNDLPQPPWHEVFRSGWRAMVPAGPDEPTAR